MLPVLVYETEEQERARILSFLREFDREDRHRCTVIGNVSSMKHAFACLDREQGILMLIIGIRPGAGAEAVKLERKAGRNNRDSYCLYWLHDLRDLPEIASQCQHPAGFILPPPEQARFNEVLERIMADYNSLTGTPGDSFVSFQCGGTMHRLFLSSIDYIESLDKRLNIYTDRQCLTVYETLGRLETVLGDRFFRCHRSYLINYSHMASVDFAAMELRLQSGVRLPLSRSAKERLKQRVQEEGASA